MNDQAKAKKNRRNFARISSRLHALFEPIDSLPSYWTRTSSVYFIPSGVDISPTEQNMDLYNMYRLMFSGLSAIKEEIRRIKEHMGIKTADLKEHDMVISGSGMSFYSDKLPEENGLLSLTLVLLLDLPVKIKAVGEIIAPSEYDEKKKKYLYRVKFVVIHEDDRELIIKYTFKRQRELINIQKSEAPAETV